MIHTQSVVVFVLGVFLFVLRGFVIFPLTVICKDGYSESGIFLMDKLLDKK